MMCKSEVTQDILSRTDFCFFIFRRVHVGVLSIFTGAIIVFAILNSNIQFPINANFHSSRLAEKVFSDDMSGLEPVVFLEKGARVMLTINLLSTVYWDTC